MLIAADNGITENTSVRRNQSLIVVLSSAHKNHYHFARVIVVAHALNETIFLFGNIDIKC